MRKMYDSLNPAAIPTTAELVASYIDGENAPAAGWEARFPNSKIVRIARVATTNAGDVGDIETTDLTPQDAVSWVKLRRAAGANPTIYANESTWPAVLAAFQAAQEAPPQKWRAAWDSQATLEPGEVAHQYENAALTGGDWDLSVVADVWPGVDDQAPSPPAPAPEPVVLDVPTPGGSYRVVAGDTLSGISQRAYGNSENWPAIWHANTNIANPDLIFPGEVIQIPDLAQPLPSFRRYTVVPGDSLWAIAARQYGQGALWSRIYDANKAEIDVGGGPSDIHPGLELVIPDA